ncbi:MAG: Rieske (2Fe-2S) protein [Pseudomonadota bacterium]
MAKNRRNEAEEQPPTALPNRRDVLGVGGGLLIGAALTAPSGASAAKPPEKMVAQPGDRIQIIKGALKDQMVRPELLEAGAKPFEAFPFDPENGVLRRKYRLNRMLVLRLDPAEMDDATRELSADGVLVFSALCTHRACTIKSWKAEERQLRCHCHLSEFAALAGGSVTDGPARRRLPMVPLALDEEGFIVAKESFNGKVGAAKK